MIIKWLLIVLIAVAVILFLGSIFKWFDLLFIMFGYDYRYEPLSTYLTIQFVAMIILLLLYAFSLCTWADSAMNTVFWSICVTAALAIVACLISPPYID